MALPFTHDQFLDVFAAYNRAIWPAVIGLWAITALAVARWYAGAPGSPRLLSIVLALHWAWSGAVYHLAFFRPINPAATLFGIVFLVQAVLFLWRGIGGEGLVIKAPKSGWQIPATLLIVYAMAYPALGVFFGLTVPRLPSFGVPCPTALLTLGVLLLVPRPAARLLGVIPVLWALVGGSAAWLLQIRADLALPVGGLLLLVYMITPQGSRSRAGYGD